MGTALLSFRFFVVCCCCCAVGAVAAAAIALGATPVATTVDDDGCDDCCCCCCWAGVAVVVLAARGVEAGLGAMDATGFVLAADAGAVVLVLVEAGGLGLVAVVVVVVDVLGTAATLGGDPVAAVSDVAAFVAFEAATTCLLIELVVAIEASTGFIDPSDCNGLTVGGATEVAAVPLAAAPSAFDVEELADCCCCLDSTPLGRGIVFFSFDASSWFPVAETFVLSMPLPLPLLGRASFVETASVAGGAEHVVDFSVGTDTFVSDACSVSRDVASAVEEAASFSDMVLPACCSSPRQPQDTRNNNNSRSTNQTSGDGEARSRVSRLVSSRLVLWPGFSPNQVL